MTFGKPARDGWQSVSADTHVLGFVRKTKRGWLARTASALVGWPSRQDAAAFLLIEDLMSGRPHPNALVQAIVRRNKERPLAHAQ